MFCLIHVWWQFGTRSEANAVQTLTYSEIYENILFKTSVHGLINLFFFLGGVLGLSTIAFLAWMAWTPKVLSKKMLNIKLMWVDFYFFIEQFFLWLYSLGPCLWHILIPLKSMTNRISNWIKIERLSIVMFWSTPGRAAWEQAYSNNKSCLKMVSQHQYRCGLKCKNFILITVP